MGFVKDASDRLTSAVLYVLFMALGILALMHRLFAEFVAFAEKKLFSDGAYGNHGHGRKFGRRHDAERPDDDNGVG